MKKKKNRALRDQINAWANEYRSELANLEDWADELFVSNKTVLGDVELVEFSDRDRVDLVFPEFTMPTRLSELVSCSWGCRELLRESDYFSIEKNGRTVNVSAL